MRERGYGIYEKYHRELKLRKRRNRLFVILSSVIVSCTVAALILPAISRTGQPFCGLEEHQHNEECYEKVLICGFENEFVSSDSAPPPNEGESGIEDSDMPLKTEEEALESHEEETILPTESENAEGTDTDIILPTETETAEGTDTTLPPEAETTEDTEAPLHEHDESCYETIIVCDIDEHTHTLGCMSDPDADEETEEDFLKDFESIRLTGDYGKDILAIAETQLGYKESQRNYTLDESGTTKYGYTRYGAWYGDPYGEWNSAFVSFCAHYANAKIIPKSNDCADWIIVLKDIAAIYYREKDEFVPLPGDLVFFDTDNDAVPETVGIVCQVGDDFGIKVIEGDKNGEVMISSHLITDDSILCYISLQSEAASPEPLLIQQEIIAQIYTDESHSTLSSDETVITISGILPENATASAHPVTLENKNICGQTLVAAYDITIRDANGNLFSTSDDENGITVTIHPPDLQIGDEDEYSVYHIPKVGSPEKMEVTDATEAVSFITDHFSVFALTRSGTMTSVYLNGTNGNDSAAGTSSAPVKTFDAAVALLAPNGTIYISGTVSITDTVLWSLGPDQKIQRASNFTDALVKVKAGASLTLSEITINGGSQAPATDVEKNSTFATGKSKAPLIVVEENAVMTITDGAVLEYNSNEPNSSNNKFVESGYIGLGGAIYSLGDLTITGGTIRYCEAQCGGGIYAGGGTIYMSGGLIDNNVARDIVSYKNRMENYHKNAGGGIYLCDYVHMYLSGGTISNNKSSREGGGISLGWLDRNNGSAIYEYVTFFTMTGGTITENYAVSTGGGINVTAGCEAIISAGYITNNTAEGKEYQDSDYYVNSGTYGRVYSGGGIYIDAQQWDSRGNSAGVPGRCVIHRVIITDNEASSNGGGLATCSTSNTTVGAVVDLGDGTAIYNNTGANGNELYIYSSSASIGGTVLGGGKYNWSKSGNYYDNSLTDSSSAIITAKTLATVYITGNDAYLGGGIGCNGIIIIGGDEEETSISIEKLWVDTVSSGRPDYIEVQIYQNEKAYGDPVRIYPVINEDGEEEWPVYYVDSLPAGYTYTIKEVNVPGYTSTISSNKYQYTITNTATGFAVTKKWVGDTEEDRPESITVQLYQNGTPYGDTQQLTEKTNWSYMWFDLPEFDENGNAYVYTAREVEIPDGYMCTQSGQLNEDGIYEIENTKIPTTSVSAEKKWADGTAGTDSITLHLLANGVEYGSPVILNAENEWFYLWENLPTMTAYGDPITYTVKEDRISGYYVEITTSTVAPTTTGWEEVTRLTSGKKYLFVSSKGALSGTSSNTLAWLDVSENIENGTMPDGSAIWTYQSNRLKNEDNKYLTIQSSGGSYTFRTNSSGTNVSFSNKRLSASSRYFTGINSSNYGSTSTSTSNAVSFTAYELSTVSKVIGETHYVVTNTPRDDSITIKFIKYIAKEDINEAFPILPGAEFALYCISESGEIIPGTDVNGVLIDQWISESALADSHGAHELELTDGTYYLIETNTPDGYVKLSGPIIFTVNSANGTITIVQYPGFEDLISSTTENGVLTDVEGFTDFPIYNAVKFVLPETGSTGTLICTSAGLLLIMSSVVLLCCRNKKHRKRELNSS